MVFINGKQKQQKTHIVQLSFNPLEE